MKEKLKFTILCIASILLSFAVVAAFVEPAPAYVASAKKKVEPESEKDLETILTEDKLLHAKLAKVQELNKNYLTFKIAGAKGADLENVNTLKIKEAANFTNYIDSLEANNKSNKAFVNLIRYFRQESKMYDFPESFFTKDDLNPHRNEQQNQVQKLQSVLHDKETLIANLQSQLKSSSHASDNNNEEKTKKTDGEIKFLKWALSSEVQSNFVLTKSNKSLKETNMELTAQMNELKKSGGGSKN